MRCCGPVGVGEEAVVTDAVEPVGQDMDQEAADELVGVERHRLVAGIELGPVILPFESHALAVEGSRYGNGSCDSVQAPVILMATMGYSASASTFGNSAQGCAGGGGSNGCCKPSGR
jgi:hypothetical protein